MKRLEKSPFVLKRRADDTGRAGLRATDLY
jgi:hypothetical protein